MAFNCARTILISIQAVLMIDDAGIFLFVHPPTHSNKDQKLVIQFEDILGRLNSVDDKHVIKFLFRLKKYFSA